ncbi:MAG TPA: GNAT family N-acetyltransferase [Ktedonobacterales bacterium]|jgi:ribosomal protein S18 acetylase RimI-like enzyme|nr:GNAT family N-acetyltransferase [Ktedonobacterales bacterium]
MTPEAVTITRERPDTADAVQLIAELEAVLDPLYPAESRHGLSVERLLAEGVAFFVLRTDGIPAGCAGIKLVDDGDRAYGEVKRMYVRPQFRGRGFAIRLLDRLEVYARSQQVDLLRLETGVRQAEAIGLYARAGFQRIPPFGPYTDDPLSCYYEKSLG